MTYEKKITGVFPLKIGKSRFKEFFTIIIMGLIPIIIINISFLKIFNDIIKENGNKTLNTVFAEKQQSIENYFHTLQNNLASFAENRMTLLAMRKFKIHSKNIVNENQLAGDDIIKMVGQLTNYYKNEFAQIYQTHTKHAISIKNLLQNLDNETIVLQNYYLTKNKFSYRSNKLLDIANDKSNYSKFHNLVHSIFRKYATRMGLEDILLIDHINGKIVYSISKHLDFGTSLITGPYKNGHLANVFHKANKQIYNRTPRPILVDFLPYAPSFEKSMAFISTPIIEYGNKTGIAVFKISKDKLVELIEHQGALGNRGGIYLIKDDGQIKLGPSNTAKSGYSLKKSRPSYLKRKFLSIYAPLNVSNLNWKILGEIDLHHLFVQKKKYFLYLLVISLILISLLIIFTAVFIKKFASPIKKDTVHKMNNLTNKLDFSLDEIDKISDEFASVGNNLASSVSQQSEATQESVSALEEMISMISRTNDFSQSSQKLANDVKNKTTEGDKIMKQLASSMTSIHNANSRLQNMEKIIKDITTKTNVINDIVFKTQLLSFNASIEAARAGQHGKGFAVVAEEVGNLAKMSGDAAQEIGNLLEDSRKQVTEMIKNNQSTVTAGQEVSDKAIIIFQNISDNISQINSQINNIAEASKEQKVGVKQTSEAMKQLNETTKENNDAADKTNELAVDLRKFIEDFRVIAKGFDSLISITGEMNSLDNLDTSSNEKTQVLSRNKTGENKEDKLQETDSNKLIDELSKKAEQKDFSKTIEHGSVDADDKDFI